MSKFTEFCVDKAVDIMIVGPLGAAVFILIGRIWGWLGWESIAIPCLLSLSGWGVVLAVRRERRRPLPNRESEDIKELLRRHIEAIRKAAGDKDAGRRILDASVAIRVSIGEAEGEAFLKHLKTSNLSKEQAVVYLESLVARSNLQYEQREERW